MMYTKTVTVEIDWLSEIDGMTVSQAIEYLKNLNQNYTLNATLEGDTHGCTLSSELVFEQPLTNKEIRSNLEKHYGKQIDHFQKAKCYYLKNGMFSRLENCANQIHKLKNLLQSAKDKYPE